MAHVEEPMWLQGHKDTSATYGWDQSLEIGIGVQLPILQSISTVLLARRLLSLSVSLLSNSHHNVSYNLGWRTLIDPSQMASESIKRYLGSDLPFALSYTYKVDRRDSELRPTEGYAFFSTSQVGGLRKNGLRIFRQVCNQLIFNIPCKVYVYFIFISFLLSNLLNIYYLLSSMVCISCNVLSYM
jgi:hypothetical protein